MQLNTGDCKRFALQLILVCSKCHLEFGSTFSSLVLDIGTNPQPFTINDIMVLLVNHSGLGYIAVKHFCGVFGIPAMHLNTFQLKEKVIAETVAVANVVLQQSANIVSAMHHATNMVDEEDSPACITINFDGMWQKRESFTL